MEMSKCLMWLMNTKPMYKLADGVCKFELPLRFSLALSAHFTYQERFKLLVFIKVLEITRVSSN